MGRRNRFVGGQGKSFVFVHYTALLTLSAIPKSLRTSAKATARLTPVWEHATSTISSRRQIGMPSCSKCMVIATNAL